VLRVKHEAEATLRPSGEPGVGLSRDVGRIVVEDQLDGCSGRIGVIEPLKEADEFPRPMAILYTRMHLAGQQVDPGQQAQRAMTFVFMIAGKSRMNPGLRRQIGCRVADRLDPRLLIIRDDRDVTRTGFCGPQNRDLAIAR
jgi:hypothetical protein